MDNIIFESGFVLIPQGRHIMTVTKINYKKEFGKLEIVMKNESNITHIERFNLKTKGGSYAFGMFAKTTLNDFGITEIDPEKLIGKKIGVVIDHREVPSTKNEGEMNTFANIVEKFVVEQTVDVNNINLDNLLG